MQKVPSTFPSEERIGFDQEARRPCRKAEERCSGTSQSESVAMSKAMTGDPRYAAVPHDPAHGPIGSFSICCIHSLGRLGPAIEWRGTPSELTNKTEASVPLRYSSTFKHKTFRISLSSAPVAIISRSRFSP